MTEKFHKFHDTESLTLVLRDWVKKLQEKGYECSEVVTSLGNSLDGKDFPEEVTATIKFKKVAGLTKIETPQGE